MRRSALSITLILAASACATVRTAELVEYQVLDKAKKVEGFTGARAWIEQGFLRYAIDLRLEDGSALTCSSRPAADNPPEPGQSASVGLAIGNLPGAPIGRSEVPITDIIDFALPGEAASPEAPRYIITVASEKLGGLEGEDELRRLREARAIFIGVHKVIGRTEDGQRLIVETRGSDRHDLPSKDLFWPTRVLAHAAFLPLYAVATVVDLPVIAGSVAFAPIVLPIYLTRDDEPRGIRAG